jgi:hypothetical protein
MRTAYTSNLGQGTDPDLVEFATWRARFEVTRGLAKGQSPREVRQDILRRFRLELEVESFGDYADERLMAAMQREIEAALGSAATA